MSNKEFLILHYQNRINRLSINPVVNKALINKARRKLRALMSD